MSSCSEKVIKKCNADIAALEKRINRRVGKINALLNEIDADITTITGNVENILSTVYEPSATGVVMGSCTARFAELYADKIFVTSTTGNGIIFDQCPSTANTLRLYSDLDTTAVCNVAGTTEMINLNIPTLKVIKTVVGSSGMSASSIQAAIQFNYLSYNNGQEIQGGVVYDTLTCFNFISGSRLNVAANGPDTTTIGQFPFDMNFCTMNYTPGTFALTFNNVDDFSTLSLLNHDATCTYGMFTILSNPDSGLTAPFPPEFNENIVLVYHCTLTNYTINGLDIVNLTGVSANEYITANNKANSYNFDVVITNTLDRYKNAGVKYITNLATPPFYDKSGHFMATTKNNELSKYSNIGITNYDPAQNVIGSSSGNSIVLSDILVTNCNMETNKVETLNYASLVGVRVNNFDVGYLTGGVDDIAPIGGSSLLSGITYSGTAAGIGLTVFSTELGKILYNRSLLIFQLKFMRANNDDTPPNKSQHSQYVDIINDKKALVYRN